MVGAGNDVARTPSNFISLFVTGYTLHGAERAFCMVCLSCTT
jgi:hypothetical protein